MLARRFPFALVVVLSILTSNLLAQNDVADAKQPYVGRVNATSVFVRSGAGENYYPCMMLQKGTEVQVVGITFDWLKITPPEGSFSYIPKLYVQRHGDGSAGKVTQDATVRAGSTLNSQVDKVQVRLSAGADVTIIGQHDEYFKIAPPEGAILYINKQYVEPIKAINGAIAQQTPGNESTTTGDAGVSNANPEGTQTPVTSENAAPGALATGNPPTTQQSPAAANADATYEALEARFTAASETPLEEQPVAELLAGYEALIANPNLPESMKRNADLRIATLKIRDEAQKNVLDLRKKQDEMKQRQMALDAEREEIQTRIKENELTFYTAVGALTSSSLQQGRSMLYRLTDPANGRTVIYIRSDDPKIGTMLGQFVGVKGDVQDDELAKLRFIAPTDIQAIDPAKVNNGISAKIIPQSLLPRGEVQASTETD